MGDSKVILDKSGLQKNLVLIEYPGIVKNDEKMLKTLGGISKISNAICEKKKRMELKFHPDNIYNKPVYGDTYETGGLLLKIKVRKPTTNKSEEGVTNIVEILGKCKKVVKFNSLCDYQYLPLLNNPETGQVEYIYDKIVPQGIPDLEWFEKSSDQPLFCLPSTFSRSDSVAQNIHRGAQRSNLNNDVIAVVRNKNIDSMEMVSFNLTDPIPMKPDSKVLKRLKIKHILDEDLQKIKKCFEECPIWNRISLIYESKVSKDKLKCILPSFSYYYVTGPWRTMYVRYGYDPRKNFESRFYQTFDWRMRKEYGLTEMFMLKRLKNEYAVENKSQNIKLVDDNNAEKLSYPYLEEGKLPNARQCMYRYCDIKFPKIREMLEKVPTPLAGATCNEKIGWLPLGFEDECREIIWSAITDLVKSLRQKKNLKEDIEEEEEYLDEEEDEDENDENPYPDDDDQMDIDESIESYLE